VLDRDNTASDVWADTAYRSAVNLELLDRCVLQPQFQRKKPRRRKMPVLRNTTRARERSRVEHVFAARKCRLRLLVRTVGIVRARANIGLADLAYNFTRLAWLQGRPASAQYPGWRSNLDLRTVKPTQPTSTDPKKAPSRAPGRPRKL